LGARTSASISAGRGSGSTYGQVQASRTPDTIGDIGFQASASSGTVNHEFGEVQYKSPWALLAAGVDQTGSRTSVRAQARGAVSYLQHSLSLSNSIDDSFAVVDTNGLANVRVLAENRVVGITDRAGRLLVPQLRSFEINHISIDPDDIPTDSLLVTTAREVRPQDRSGVVVKFPVRASRGALVHLVDDSGSDLPVGSTVTLAATGITVPVGYDGVAYIEDLADHNTAAVRRPDGKQCGVIFDYRPLPGDIPAIGPLHCTASARRN
jgi:outer membrane usher protein